MTCHCGARLAVGGTLAEELTCVRFSDPQKSSRHFGNHTDVSICSLVWV